MNDTLHIKVNGKDRELFMSYGLLTSITQIVGLQEELTAIFLDAALQKVVIEIALNPVGTSEEDKIDLNTTKISMAEIQKILDWVGEHILDFFIQGMKSVEKLNTNNLDRMQEIVNLTSSSTGSEASLPSKPSAGPETSSPAK
jgi:hypothetical protein